MRGSVLLRPRWRQGTAVPRRLGWGYCTISMRLAQTLERALTLVPEDSLEHARVLCQLVGVYGNLDYQKGEETYKEVVAVARREKDPRLEMSAMSEWCLVEHLQMTAWPQQPDDAISLSRQLGEKNTEVALREFSAWEQAFVGCPVIALQHVDHLSGLAQELHTVYPTSRVASLRALIFV